MGVYDRQVASAERMIREKGKPVQIVRQATAVNEAEPWNPGETTVTLDDAHAIFLNFNQKDMETMGKMPDASEVLASDRKVLLAAAATDGAPTVHDKLRDEDGDWSIEYVQVLSPNGQNILYTLRVRQ